MLPTNLAALTTEDNHKGLVEEALNGKLLESDVTDELRLQHALLSFGRCWPLKITFAEPVQVMGKRGWVRTGENTKEYRSGLKTETTHIFPKLFSNQWRYGKPFTNHVPVYYLPARTMRRGYAFPHAQILSYEVVLECKDEFKSFEQFKAKFDPLFISDDEIQKLWTGKSGQHGGNYRPSDFRRLGNVGLRVMEDLSRCGFKGIGQSSYEGQYMESSYGNYKVLEVRKDSYGHGKFGRDISISHNSNASYVHYSSEFPGCGNGRYGLVANRREFLWLEDD